MIRGVMNRLTDTRLESIVRVAKKKAYDGNGKPMLVADGAGLYLQISKTGSSSWLFRYTRSGKAVAIGLGGYPTVGLQASRERAAKCRQTLEAGQDPLENKRQASKERVGLESTFDVCAKKYIAVGCAYKLSRVSLQY